MRPPPKWPFFWGGSTFWIFWWCNGRILLKIFLVRILGKRIFWRNFRPIGRNFGRRPTNEISKIEDFWKFFSNVQFFFFQIGSKHQHEPQKNKKIFSRSNSLLKAPKKIFHSNWLTFHVKILVQRHYVNFFCRKKTQKFSSFFTSWKMRENVKKQKIQKKINTFFFRKKNIFLIFCNSHFFMENRQIRPKTGQKCWQHMSTWY